MRGFRNVKSWAESDEAGRSHSCSFRKVVSQTTAANVWVDLSMSGGNPSPNYYASSPLESSVFDGFKGLFHGDDKAPASKYLTGFGISVVNANSLGLYRMLDYLLYYPFIDGDSLDQQDLVNSQSLPRYTDGKGVQVMAVCVAPTTAQGSFTFTYVNQDDVEKTSPVITTVSSANIGTILTGGAAVAGAHGPFLRLAAGDTGVKRIVSVSNASVYGGLVSLVLVKPLAETSVWAVSTATEKAFLSQGFNMPKIEDGAYLNLIVLPAGNMSSQTIAGYFNFIWSES